MSQLGQGFFNLGTVVEHAFGLGQLDDSFNHVASPGSRVIGEGAQGLEKLGTVNGFELFKDGFAATEGVAFLSGKDGFGQSHGSSV